MCLGEPKGGDEARGGLGVGSGSDVPKEGVSTSAEGGLPIVGSSSEEVLSSEVSGVGVSGSL